MKMQRIKNTAIILAAGQGKRMNSTVPKQYLLLKEKPVLFYSLDIFQRNQQIDDIILVVGQEQIDYCKRELVDKYGFSKVSKIIEGGKERYLSVLCGIKEAENADYILVHDGARPFVTQEIVERTLESAICFGTGIAGVPVKDTIKLCDEKGFVTHTPNRNFVWAIQTPQVFRADILAEAYEKLMLSNQSDITDDAMVVERMLDRKVKLVLGDYKNIKITTPEDLETGEFYMLKML
ncbi:2-C-methyl-D-erythritol 4-phosphate cytidylyltransferase [[Clostridium] polysaccharolyticum]|uniref:2-C-methyl-D-erythritol 4-phosphate cytidylyltransferase n=1 Tax=[Clostridium] polysaccharolyticum TaxID=29364 RepID=A0A1I0FC08_9FIRM|nr:2-C-methyl-D-erythritol 4-phosphate cytidylyltransferase [[Clostridium] polysaccharolyticum]SET55661.1 2-C-methyl-D-erythritol 4-phosphate cytidylyltransferase [[Clostridium] polysaccharolyticum]